LILPWKLCPDYRSQLNRQQRQPLVERCSRDGRSFGPLDGWTFGAYEQLLLRHLETPGRGALS
jgi:hypothetical protein